MSFTKHRLKIRYTQSSHRLTNWHSCIIIIIASWYNNSLFDDIIVHTFILSLTVKQIKNLNKKITAKTQSIYIQTTLDIFFTFQIYSLDKCSIKRIFYGNFVRRYPSCIQFARLTIVILRKKSSARFFLLAY